MSRFRFEPVELFVPWRGSVTIDDPPRRGGWLDICVSDVLARYWILAAPAGLASARELDLYAAGNFAAIFGEDPAGWTLRFDPEPRSRAWLACALPRAVSEELPRQAIARGWRVRHVQPQFVRAYNQNCRRLGRTAAFGLAAADSTTIGVIVAGCWRSIRIHPPLDRSRADFATLLRRDCRQAGLEGVNPDTLIVGPLSEKATA